jgi:hypothetical protein
VHNPVSKRNTDLSEDKGELPSGVQGWLAVRARNHALKVPGQVAGSLSKDFEAGDNFLWNIGAYSDKRVGITVDASGG